VLGLEVAVVGAGRSSGLQVTKTLSGGIAEKAGIRDGDVIRSINGYVTEQPGHIAWILANAAHGDVLQLTLRPVDKGTSRTVKARLQ
jgi:S1-C subfamily serine protease